jgi:hypothetical protein
METTRWVTYEECVESADGHWGLPHISLVDMGAMRTLRTAITNGFVINIYIRVSYFIIIGVCLFDLHANNYGKIIEDIVEKGYNQFGLDRVRTSAILHSLMQQNKFVLYKKYRYCLTISDTLVVTHAIHSHESNQICRICKFVCKAKSI